MFGIFRRRGQCDPSSSSAKFDAVAAGGIEPAAPSYDDSFILLEGSHGGTLVASRSDGAKDPPYAVLAEGSIYNRTDLISELKVAPFHPQSDADLLCAAYVRWGSSAPSHIIGDWCFAVWHPAERELFLARDHTGTTTLYYCANEAIFAFSTSRRRLLGLTGSAIELDELYLAQVLISWFAYQGERTIHRPIRRLPPAHCLTVTPDRIELRKYWYLEDTPEQRLSRRDDYAAGLRDVFDRAVNERLTPDRSLAATLSGGLDSGSVVVTAADLLRREGRSLTAYVSVPVSDTVPYFANLIGNELKLAQTTATKTGNVELRPLAAAVNPIEAIRDALEITLEPLHAASNLYWLLDLYRSAAGDGYRRILTGQDGNGGISWTGDLRSHPLMIQVRYGSIRRLLRSRLRSVTPDPIVDYIRRLRQPIEWPRTAIAPLFAERVRLYQRRADDPWEADDVAPQQRRLKMIRPGSSIAGAVHAELSHAFGLRVSDPTADPRVLSFCLSVPDAIYIDPDSGMDRWLIRAAMQGRLPDQVRLNRRRGLQAADIVTRLRERTSEVNTVLDEVAAGPGAAYLDAGYMKRVWRRAQVEASPEVYGLVVAVLLRGIMAGLFVNGFGNRW